MWAWGGYLIIQNLSFLISKIVVTLPTSQSGYEDSMRKFTVSTSHRACKCLHLPVEIKLPQSSPHFQATVSHAACLTMRQLYSVPCIDKCLIVNTLAFLSFVQDFMEPTYSRQCAVQLGDWVNNLEMIGIDLDYQLCSPVLVICAINGIFNDKQI